MTNPAKLLLAGFVALTLGASLPASASGGMILVSLEEVHATASANLSGEMADNPGPLPGPEKFPQRDGYHPDSTQNSNCGGGDVSTQSGPVSSALCPAVELFILRPNINSALRYSNPPVLPAHLCRLFRPPRV